MNPASQVVGGEPRRRRRRAASGGRWAARARTGKRAFRAHLEPFTEDCEGRSASTGGDNRAGQRASVRDPCRTCSLSGGRCQQVVWVSAMRVSNDGGAAMGPDMPVRRRRARAAAAPRPAMMGRGQRQISPIQPFTHLGIELTPVCLFTQASMPCRGLQTGSTRRPIQLGESNQGRGGATLVEQCALCAGQAVALAEARSGKMGAEE